LSKVKIVHHGAVTGVTGSYHQYLAGTSNILVDCGLFQGAEASRDLSDFDFDPKAVDALIVTHGHIDHVGRIPWLIAAGFRGSIICSPPTAVLLPIILRDALDIHLPENQALVDATLQRIEQAIVPLAFGHWHNQGDVQVRLQNAGHILGSAYVELNFNGHTTVFSGDLGSPGAVFVEPPCSPEKANILVIESTYGDKNHTTREHREHSLAKLTNKALADGGTLLIPAFSLGRTQELLSFFEHLLFTGQLKWPEASPLPIILDSPLAGELTSAYRQLAEYWPESLKSRKSQGRLPLGFDNLVTVQSHKEHLKLVSHLARKERPAIVIAASGMCQGGRIVNYLEALLPLKSTEVLFVGYQASGTLGRSLQNASMGKVVHIEGRPVVVNAEIFSISGFSAHADQSDLIRFIEGITPKPDDVRLVHGDNEAKQVLAGKLVETGYSVTLAS